MTWESGLAESLLWLSRGPVIGGATSSSHPSVTVLFVDRTVETRRTLKKWTAG